MEHFTFCFFFLRALRYKIKEHLQNVRKIVIKKLCLFFKYYSWYCNFEKNGSYSLLKNISLCLLRGTIKLEMELIFDTAITNWAYSFCARDLKISSTFNYKVGRTCSEFVNHALIYHITWFFYICWSFVQIVYSRKKASLELSSIFALCVWIHIS